MHPRLIIRLTRTKRRIPVSCPSPWYKASDPPCPGWPRPRYGRPNIRQSGSGRSDSGWIRSKSPAGNPAKSPPLRYSDNNQHRVFRIINGYKVRCACRFCHLFTPWFWLKISIHDPISNKTFEKIPVIFLSQMYLIPQGKGKTKKPHAAAQGFRIFLFRSVLLNVQLLCHFHVHRVCQGTIKIIPTLCKLTLLD